MNDNFYLILNKFIRLLGVKVTSSSIREYLSLHPHSPSLLSYSDALKEWKIENAALHLQPDQLDELPAPYISFLRKDGGVFTIVTKATQEHIHRYDSESGNVVEPRAEYVKAWTGVVLLAEAGAASGEDDFSRKRKKEVLKNSRMPLAIGALSIAFLSLLNFGPFGFGTASITILGLNTIGLIACSLLLIQTVSRQDTFIQKLCNVGPKTNCQNILQSDAAKITSWLSWAEVGFLYFVSTTIVLVLSHVLSGGLSLFLPIGLATIAIAVLFSFYSFYYQARVAKMWCPLCVLVMAVFWLELIAIIVMEQAWPIFNDWPGKQDLSIWMFAVSVPCGTWLLVKQNVIEANEGRVYKAELAKLRSNATLFDTLLKSQKRMPVLSAELGAVSFGNPEAQHTLTVVTDPTCNPCAMMFGQIRTLLGVTDRVNCQFLFVANNEPGALKGKVARKILSLEPERQLRALEAWYAQDDKNIEKWEHQLGDLVELPFSFQLVEMQNQWINEAKVNMTPTVFFDGYLLPEMYQIRDLENISRYYTESAVVT